MRDCCFLRPPLAFDSDASVPEFTSFDVSILSCCSILVGSAPSAPEESLKKEALSSPELASLLPLPLDLYFCSSLELVVFRLYLGAISLTGAGPRLAASVFFSWAPAPIGFYRLSSLFIPLKLYIFNFV